jgi:eukaryotic-like serine/threonine-protein kinase
MTAASTVFELLEELLESGKSPEEICQDRPDLLPEVRRQWKEFCLVDAKISELLPNSSNPDNRAGQAAVSPTAALPQIPGYDVQSVLGSGGMGVVFKARQLALDRPVAIKMLLGGAFAGGQELARFRREAEALAGLRHSNIVQVYDAGEVGGHPYFAMEFIDGGTLSQQLSATPQPSNRAAELIANLARAVEFAHRNGILHRDLKPSNVMLTADGTPKIADFGLALTVNDPTRVTVSGARMGTPSYMAPEQALGKTDAIGPAVDVYALGAMLYELLTGRPPFKGDSALETEQQVIAVEPTPPSRWNDKIPRDLETICLKCLQKSASRRYASAQALADDLERFLTHRPILARPVGWMERALRWAQRNRGLAAALSGMAALLFFVAVGSLIAAAYFERLAQEKGELADDKSRLANENETARQRAVEAQSNEKELRQLAETQSDTLRRNLYIAQMNLAGQAATSQSGLARVQDLLSGALKQQADLRNWEWYYLNGWCHRALMTLDGHLDEVLAAAWSPDGRRLATSGADGRVLLWDTTEGRVVRVIFASQRAVRSIAFSPDGARLASASWDGLAKVWDVGSGKNVLSYGVHSGPVFAVAWSPDGKRLATGGGDKTVHVWNAADGKNVFVLSGHTGGIRGVAWSPDGKQLASASDDHTVRLWDPANGKPTSTLLGHLNWVNCVAWNRKGDRLASGSNDCTVKLWYPSTAKEVSTIEGHAQGVASLAWSPDGTRLASASEDRTVRIWPMAGGPSSPPLRGHSGRCTSVAWSPDGKRLVSAAYDSTIKIWDADPVPETISLRGITSSGNCLAWRPDGECFACASAEETITVWDRKRFEQRFILRGPPGSAHCVVWSPDGKRLASGGADLVVHIWDAASRKEVQTLRGHKNGITSIRWSPDGTRLASASLDMTTRVWDAISGRSLQTIRGETGFVDCVVWSPDGKRLATGSWGKTVEIWDGRTGGVIRRLPKQVTEVAAAAWSPRGNLLASGGMDGVINIWNADTGDLRFALGGHTAQVTALDWNPDGTRLASSSWDGTVKVWDVQTQSETLSLRGSESRVNALAWSPDGLVIVSCGDDGTITARDATTGYVAARSPEYLPVLDRKLAADPKDAADWRLRGEIEANCGQWDKAAADFEKFLALDKRRPWLPLAWSVAGPFPEDMHQHFAPEWDSTIDQSPVRAAPGAQAPHWEHVPADACGFLNFGARFGHAEHISAYARLCIYSPRTQPVTILLGSDDQARLWLNGRQILDSPRERAAVPDQDVVPATLEAGWNTLLARVANIKGEHVLYLRLSNPTTK